MKINTNIVALIFALLLVLSCKKEHKQESQMQPHKNIQAIDILGNPKYLAISYGGYRQNSRDIQPSVEELKEDMLILSAMGIKILRTYNVQFEQTANILRSIKELKDENSDFEMYVMLGAWIDCDNAWTDQPNHEAEDVEANTAEIDRAVVLANAYPEIVKIIAVGNEAMVHWATSYYVKPAIILKWVNYLQNLKTSDQLPKDLWITSSDNFASWGGGVSDYHNHDLVELIKSVDYISMHTYAYHDTHYTPAYWINDTTQYDTDLEKIEGAMLRAKHYAMSQYEGVKSFIDSLGIEKPIHVGESGWASESNGFYGKNGSKATDEYKAALYYKHIRDWTNAAGMSCFYFEAFNENWKDAQNPLGSENHFGLFTIEGKAKYALWDLVDQGVFKGLTRNGKPIVKTYNGNKEAMMKDVLVPETKAEIINN